MRVRISLVVAPLLAGCGARVEKFEEPEPVATAFTGGPKRAERLEIAGVDASLADAIAREIAYPPDLVGAARGYTEACARGDAVGCYLLLLVDRTRPERNESKRAAVTDGFEAACAGDDAVGCHLLALVLDDDEGVPIDGKRALSLYKKACDLGFDPGCVRASVVFAFGPEANEAGARERLLAARSKACKAGFPSACRSAPALKYPGDDARACALGDLETCAAQATGPGAAAAKKQIERMKAPLAAICEAARLPDVCAAARRHGGEAP